MTDATARDLVLVYRGNENYLFRSKETGEYALADASIEGMHGSLCDPRHADCGANFFDETHGGILTRGVPGRLCPNGSVSLVFRVRSDHVSYHRQSACFEVNTVYNRGLTRRLIRLFGNFPVQFVLGKAKISVPVADVLGLSDSEREKDLCGSTSTTSG